MNRIPEKFAKLKSRKRSALVPFIMGGDPDLKTTAALLPALVESGADLIEIGMPFSDPVADGPVIQQAGLRALKNNISLDDIFALVAAFRESNNETPIILMGYYNPVYRYGVENFCKNAVKAGIDGVILVDLPPEEEGEFIPDAEKAGLSLIKLITPTGDSARLKTILKTASGFVYYVTVAGITGDKSAEYNHVATAVKALRRETDLPIAVGFGIKTAEDVKTISGFADAAVVGSALIAHMQNNDAPIEAAKGFLASLQVG